jgi:murein DD-endopeptidase MepM/ murein hydrolase activator NlpD
LDGRRGQHRTESDLIDLGNEPPLSVDGGEDGAIDRRRVSVQWLSGTILTGLCGAALMGGAVFTSLDGEAHFAALPERVEGALRGALGGIGERLMRKADKLPPPGEINAARQIIRVSMTSRSGNREIVRVRPFVRVSANLSMSLSELSTKIPTFNPQKLLAEGGGETDTTASANPGASAEPDAEVSFVMRDLAPMIARVKIASTMPIDEVMTRVRDIGLAQLGESKVAYAPGLQQGGVLAYAPQAGADLYRGFDARIVPENITLLPKSSEQATGGNSWSERAITAKKNDSASTILRDLGATPDEIRQIQSALGGRGRDGALKEGTKLRVLLSAVPGSSRQQPVRVIIANDSAIEAVVALSDAGKYVSVDVTTINNTEVADSSDDEDDDGSGVRLYQSIYETALRNQIPPSVIDDMVRIYSYDVDFQRKAAPGDSLDVLYAGEEETTGGDKNSEVLFAALTVGGETKKFYRFQTPDDGVVDYYDETGKSAKKFLVRKPVADGIMRSPFGVRRHPILGYTKMHTGVDWAAPTGTPIFASGNGVIERIGWESGYGKYVRIRHANGYETAYGHMTAFARNMDVGTHVRQGQVIGFVGSTGLSTGAHVHYEILVNGRFVDPMRIKLPRGRSLDGGLLANFEQERNRLDAMMTTRPARVAQSGR